METTFRALQESTISCANGAAQRAAVAAMRGNQRFLTDAAAHYRRNLKAACALLDERNIKYVAPEGAFYLWIDVSVASAGNVTRWREEFLATERVALAPGTAFGAAGEGWVRACTAGQLEPLLEGLRRLPATP